MPRIRKTGAVYPIRHEQRKTLKDGTVKTYVNWQAKVDGRWVSAKTYKECDRKIAEALKEKTEWGMGVDRATRLGEYAERWFELKRRDLKPKSINNCFASMFVRQVRQCFSAVWADGFPRCRHRFPVM